MGMGRAEMRERKIPRYVIFSPVIAFPIQKKVSISKHIPLPKTAAKC